MNPTEANRLLAHAAAFDNRNPSAAAAEAWAAALHDVPFDADALAAVARFYGTEDPRATGQRWIQPHQVRAHRKAIRAERLEDFRYVPIPGDDDPKVFLVALREQRTAVADGRREAVPALPPGEPRDVDLETMFADVFRRPPAADKPRVPEQQPAETPEETRRRRLAEVYGYLLAIDSEAARDAMAAARAQLGPDAEQADVALLAATLTTARPAPAKPDKATADVMAAQGCPNGCPLGTHVAPCHWAGAS